jgi:hypothetical protein
VVYRLLPAARQPPPAPEGFEETQGDIAMGEILPGQQRDLLPEDGEVQVPVDEQ